MSDLSHVISPSSAVTLHGLFLERVKRTPDAVAYRYFELSSNTWLTLTWHETAAQVARWQAVLLRENLAAGERVAVMLRNCPQWIFFDQAAMSLGLVVVPLYTVDRPDSVAFIVNDAGAKVLLFETAEQWQALHSVCDKMPSVQRFISLEVVSQPADTRLQAAPDMLPQAASLLACSPIDSHQLATIIYTSGTTGRPKGVMLSHLNILFDAHAVLSTFAVRSDDLFLSFLPLSHTFERTCGYYLPVMTGSTVAYARSIPLLAEDLQHIRPTILVSVPRIYERVYAAIHNKLEEGSPLKQKLFKLAVEVGWARFLREQGRGGWQLNFLLWPLLQKLVAQKVLDKLGGRLRVAISGGAALSPTVSRLFVGLGLPVVQGYGLTETSPIVTGNAPENNYPESVGQPIRGVEVRIGAHNALMVRGANVMLGYWHNEAATRAMIDAEGWLNTGDTAHITETGHVIITGRLKEIIVMSNGEKIPPADIELAILRDNLFDQVMVHGEGQPYLIVLAVVNPEVWQHWAQSVGVSPDMRESFSDTRIEAQVLVRIAEQMREFPGYARVRRVLLMREPWTIENGLLTPTLKLKRPRAVEKFVTEIAQMYAGH